MDNNANPMPDLCECGHPRSRHIEKGCIEATGAHTSCDCPAFEPMAERAYFAYRLNDGKIRVRSFSASSLAEAEESDFVDACTGRYIARNRAHAEEIAKSYLSQVSPDAHLDDVGE